MSQSKGIKALLLNAGSKNHPASLEEITLPEDGSREAMNGLIHTDCSHAELVQLEETDFSIDAFVDDFGMSRRPLVPAMIVSRGGDEMILWGNVIFAKRSKKGSGPWLESLTPSDMMKVAECVKIGRKALAKHFRKKGQ